MKLFVNAEPRDVQATNLAEVLPELGFNCRALATALNGTFVPSEDRVSTNLTDGDRLEVLAPMQGG